MLTLSGVFSLFLSKVQVPEPLDGRAHWGPHFSRSDPFSGESPGENPAEKGMRCSWESVDL